MRKLKDLKDARLLGKKDQQAIKGGSLRACMFTWQCPDGTICFDRICVRI